MSDAKHTPGTWEYRPTQYHDWGTVCAGNFTICQAREPVTTFNETALSEHRKNGTDPWEANARLIAAAPELLEALEDLLEVCAHSVGELDPREPIKAARAAIAKARGEAQ